MHPLAPQQVSSLFSDTFYGDVGNQFFLEAGVTVNLEEAVHSQDSQTARAQQVVSLLGLHTFSRGRTGSYVLPVITDLLFKDHPVREVESRLYARVNFHVLHVLLTRDLHGALLRLPRHSSGVTSSRVIDNCVHLSGHSELLKPLVRRKTKLRANWVVLTKGVTQFG